MTTTRRAELRRIMQEAWSWFRQVGGTFADALRTAWHGHRVRARPRVQLQPVKSGARALSPLREQAFLAQRFNRRSSGFRYAAASAPAGGR